MNEGDMLTLIMLSHRMTEHDMGKALVLRLSREGYRQFYKEMKGYYDNKLDAFMLLGFKVKVLTYSDK